MFWAKKLNCIGEEFVPQTVCLLSEVKRYTAELSFGSSGNTLSQRAQNKCQQKFAKSCLQEGELSAQIVDDVPSRLA